MKYATFACAADVHARNPARTRVSMFDTASNAKECRLISFLPSLSALARINVYLEGKRRASKEFLTRLSSNGINISRWDKADRNGETLVQSGIRTIRGQWRWHSGYLESVYKTCVCETLAAKSWSLTRFTSSLSRSKFKRCQTSSINGSGNY